MQSEGVACSFLKRGRDAAISHTIQAFKVGFLTFHACNYQRRLQLGRVPRPCRIQARKRLLLALFLCRGQPIAFPSDLKHWISETEGRKTRKSPIESSSICGLISTAFTASALPPFLIRNSEFIGSMTRNFDSPIFLGACCTSGATLALQLE